jgi:hypothetical protein
MKNKGSTLQDISFSRQFPDEALQFRKPAHVQGGAGNDAGVTLLFIRETA